MDRLAQGVTNRAHRCTESEDQRIQDSHSQPHARFSTFFLRVRILNSLVFSFSTTVRAIRDSLREAVHACSASFRIIGSISASKTSCSKVSSEDMDCVGLSGTTSLLSIPRANS